MIQDTYSTDFNHFTILNIILSFNFLTNNINIYYTLLTTFHAFFLLQKLLNKINELSLSKNKRTTEMVIRTMYVN